MLALQYRRRQRRLICSLCVALAACDPTLAERDQPIAGGTTTAADPAVVAIVVDNHELCTGVLVAPRVVVTAAHCVVNKSPRVYFGPGITVGPGRFVDVLLARPHAAFDGAALTNDVAVVLLAEAASEPALLVGGPPLVGDVVQVLGFGHTGPEGAGDHVKRTGTSRVESIAETSFDVAPDPAQPCEGDSGGPALLGGVVVGIVSSGDVTCASTSRLMRADAYAGFIGDFVLDTLDGALPPPGADDEPCEYNDECVNGHCGKPDLESELRCASFCVPGAALPCKDGFRCQPDAQTDRGYLCFAEHDDGCRTTRGSGAGLIVLVLLALTTAMRGTSRAARSS